MSIEDFDQWKEKVEIVKRQNAQLLNGYKLWLELATLSDLEKAQYHAGITFFANTFLTMENVIPVEQGYTEIDTYLGDFFIREVPWATPETIESAGKGFVNFFLYLNKAHDTPKENLEYVKKLIHSETPKWIKNYHLYNSSCEF